MKPISIYSQQTRIYLQVKSYHINLVGGFYFEENSFSIRLIHVKTGETIIPKRTKWNVQSHQFGKRSKRIFTIDIQEAGNYRLIFHTPEKLIVRKSSLFISHLFYDPVPNEEISVFFEGIG